ncbi:unnamed protein product [Rhizophagus irregularis]|nr:unnamed protein product [Rhizophagus irregularis]
MLIVFVFEVCVSTITNTFAPGTFFANFNVGDLTGAFVDGTSTDTFSNTATGGACIDEFNLVLSLSALLLAISNTCGGEFNSLFSLATRGTFSSSLLLATGDACEGEFDSALSLATSSDCESEFNLALSLVTCGACRGEFNSVLLW